MYFAQYLLELWFCFTQDFDSKFLSVVKFRLRYKIVQVVPRKSGRLCSLHSTRDETNPGSDTPLVSAPLDLHILL